MRTLFLAVATTLALGAPMAHAVGGTFQCENPLDMDSDESRAIAGSNNGLFNVLNKYRERWDVAEMRKQCEAYAAGEPYEISCLNGRRDWDAIRAMVPAEYFGMSTFDLTPHYHDLQKDRADFAGTIEYCRSVGAIK